MTTLTIKIVNDNGAVMQVLRGLSKMGAISIESDEAPYDPAMVEKIRKSERQLREGKGVIIDPDKLWS